MSQKIKAVNVQALWEQATQATAAGQSTVEVDAEVLRMAAELLHQAWEKVSYLEGLIIRMGRS